jgi:hypothetical protein
VPVFAILADTEVPAGLRSEDRLSRIAADGAFRDAMGCAQVDGEQRKDLLWKDDVVGLRGEAVDGGVFGRACDEPCGSVTTVSARSEKFRRNVGPCTCCNEISRCQ